MGYAGERGEELSKHTLRVPKEATVADVLAELKRQLGDNAPAQPMRLLEIYISKIHKVVYHVKCTTLRSFLQSVSHFLSFLFAPASTADNWKRKVLEQPCPVLGRDYCPDIFLVTDLFPRHAH